MICICLFVTFFVWTSPYVKYHDSIISTITTTTGTDVLLCLHLLDTSFMRMESNFLGLCKWTEHRSLPLIVLLRHGIQFLITVGGKKICVIVLYDKSCYRVGRGQ